MRLFFKKYDLSNIADEDIKEAILTKNIKGIQTHFE
jgi:hypothetical protein